MTRVLVHFGLHKTGTSSAEKTLELNRAALAHHFTLVTRKTWPDMSAAAKAFSASHDPARLKDFSQILTARLRDLDPKKSLCISNVDLSGQLPDLAGVCDYSTIAPVLGAVRTCLLDHYGPAVNLVFMASIRPADDWLQSLYWQNLKVRRLTVDFDAFATRLRGLSDFGTVLQAARQAIGDSPLLTPALPDTAQTPLGPATPVLDAMGLSERDRTGLSKSKRLKASPSPDIRRAILEMNRSDLPDHELSEAKADLLSILNALTEDEP